MTSSGSCTLISLLSMHHVPLNKARQPLKSGRRKVILCRKRPNSPDVNAQIIFSFLCCIAAVNTWQLKWSKIISMIIEFDIRIIPRLFSVSWISDIFVLYNFVVASTLTHQCYWQQASSMVHSKGQMETSNVTSHSMMTNRQAHDGILIVRRLGYQSNM